MAAEPAKPLDGHGLGPGRRGWYGQHPSLYRRNTSITTLTAIELTISTMSAVSAQASADAASGFANAMKLRTQRMSVTTRGGGQAQEESRLRALRDRWFATR